jgi:hypothetical protein
MFHIIYNYRCHFGTRYFMQKMPKLVEDVPKAKELFGKIEDQFKAINPSNEDARRSAARALSQKKKRDILTDLFSNIYTYMLDFADPLTDDEKSEIIRIFMDADELCEDYSINQVADMMLDGMDQLVEDKVVNDTLTNLDWYEELAKNSMICFDVWHDTDAETMKANTEWFAATVAAKTQKCMEYLVAKKLYAKLVVYFDEDPFMVDLEGEFAPKRFEGPGPFDDLAQELVDAMWSL